MQKLEIIQKRLGDHISLKTLENVYVAGRSMIRHWVKAYIASDKARIRLTVAIRVKQQATVYAKGGFIERRNLLPAA